MSRGRWIRLLLALAAVELSSLGALALLATRGVRLELVPTTLSDAQRAAIQTLLAGESRYLRQDPTLGWSLIPGGAADLYHADARGLRLPAPSGDDEPSLRVQAYGDSFTHGDEVADDQTWPAALGRGSAWAVTNHGVPGFSPVQALLRWRQDQETVPGDVVIFGFVSVDLARTTSRYPPFLDPSTALALGRPSARMPGQELLVEPNPLPSPDDLRALLDAPAAELARLGRGDPYYEQGPRQSALDASAGVRLLRLLLRSRVDRDGGVRGGRPYDTSAEAFRATLALLERWQEEASGRQQRLIVLLLPGPLDIAARLSGEEPAYAPLARALRSREIPVLDAAPALASVAPDERWMPDGHYTPQANERVASVARDGIAALP